MEAINEIKALAKNRIALWGGIIGLTGLVLCSHTGKDLPFNGNNEHTIQVTGSSEMTIVPDEIEFIVGITEEYSSMASTKKPAAQLGKTETAIREKLAEIGIDKNNIKCEPSVQSYWWWYQNRNSQINKEIKFKTNDYALVNKFVDEINVKGIQYMRLGELKHSKIQEFRRQVKADALKAAKEKAGYMLEAIDRKAGEPVNIVELQDYNYNNNYYYPFYGSYSNMTSNSISNSSVYSGSGDYSANNELRSIKIRYEIQSTFVITN